MAKTKTTQIKKKGIEGQIFISNLEQNVITNNISIITNVEIDAKIKLPNRVILSKITFDEDFLINGNSSDTVFLFSECVFNKKFDFNNSQADTLDFDNCTFIGEVAFSYVYILSKLSFTKRNSFKSEITFEKISIKKIILGGEADKNIQFKGIFGCEDFILEDGKFKEVRILGENDFSFEIQSFKLDKHNFDSIIFKSDSNKNGQISQIILSDILPKDKLLIFDNIGINHLSFENFKNYGYFAITGIEPIDDNGQISIKNAELWKANFIDCRLDKYSLDFQKSKINEVFIAGGYEFREVKSSSSDIINDNRLAYGQLRKIYESRGDVATSKKYTSHELDYYRKFIISEIPNKKSYLSWLFNLDSLLMKVLVYITVNIPILFISFFHKIVNSTIFFFEALDFFTKNPNKFQEYISLVFNNLSNKNGQNWLFALGWVIGVGLVFWYWICVNLGCTLGSDIQLFKDSFPYFIEFLNPIHKSDILERYYSKVLGYDNFLEKIHTTSQIIDGVSRIIISYLEYQLIQAFRKFGKRD